ncbi:MAG: hypothetical protein ACREYE_15040 [Gammaproteobacteria bacterium]
MCVCCSFIPPPRALFAFAVARTICRRAERHLVRLAEVGEELNP